MDCTNTMDLNSNIIEKDGSTEKGSTTMQDYNDNIQKNALYVQTKLLELNSIRVATPTKSLSLDYLSDSSAESDEEDQATKDLRDRKTTERKKQLESISSALDDIEKGDINDMFAAIDSTLTRLNQRTGVIAEHLDVVQKKQVKVVADMKDNIDFIKEMRIQAQQLLKKQDQISKNYKNVESYISSNNSSSYKSASTAYTSNSTTSRTTTRKTARYSDEDDFSDEPRSRRSRQRDDVYSDEEPPKPKKKEYYSDDDYTDEEPPKPKKKEYYSDEFSDEEPPKPKKKVYYSDDDYTDEEPPKPKKKEYYSDEDYTDEEPPKPKKKVYYSDEDYTDEEPPKPKKKEYYSDEELNTPQKEREVYSDEEPLREDEEYRKEEEKKREEEKLRQEAEFEEDERLREEVVPDNKADDEDFDEEEARRLAEAEIAKLKDEVAE